MHLADGEQTRRTAIRPPDARVHVHKECCCRGSRVDRRIERRGEIASSRLLVVCRSRMPGILRALSRTALSSSRAKSSAPPSVSFARQVARVSRRPVSRVIGLRNLIREVSGIDHVTAERFDRLTVAGRSRSSKCIIRKRCEPVRASGSRRRLHLSVDRNRASAAVVARGQGV